MKAHGNLAARVHIFTAMALGRGRVASPMLSHLYPGKAPGTHFIGGWVDPRTSLDTKGVKKNLYPSDTQDRTWAIQPVAKHLTAWATLLTVLYLNSKLLNTFLFWYLKSTHQCIWHQLCVVAPYNLFSCVSRPHNFHTLLSYILLQHLTVTEI